MDTDAMDDSLLASPVPDTDHPTLERATASYTPHTTFHLPPGGARHYQQQYADMYFARLALLKPPTLALATEAFSALRVAGEAARAVDRVLDVRQGELSWVVGTVYMEMPLKPNVLEDLGKEQWIAAPPPRVRYEEETEEDEDAGVGAGRKERVRDAGTQIMLEDESGRLRLTGVFLDSVLLVTGCIVAVIGTENSDGDFEVLDLRVPDLPPQPERSLPTSSSDSTSSKIALVSGLGITGDSGSTLPLDLLLEFLLGEATTVADQTLASSISRLIISGNALAHSSPIASRADVIAASKKAFGVTHTGVKKYGYDSTAYNAAPTDYLDTFLATLLPSLPITILPGDQDPTSTALPQQPIHAAMFPHARAYMNRNPSVPDAKEDKNWFHSTTNPASFTASGTLYLGTGGQPLDDIYKYLPATTSRLAMAEAMLRWRLIAPTAPDTLWCYPFQDGDAFVLKQCPHVFFVGNQPRFETSVVEGPGGEQVRVVLVPRFAETGEVVLVDEGSLEVSVVKFEVFEGEGEGVEVVMGEEEGASGQTGTTGTTG